MYWLMTDWIERPRSLMFALEAAQEPDVCVRVDINLDVHEVAQTLVREDQDTIDQDHRLWVDVERFRPAAVDLEVVDGNFDRPARLQFDQVLDEQIIVQ